MWKYKFVVCLEKSRQGDDTKTVFPRQQHPGNSCSEYQVCLCILKSAFWVKLI